jgi:hypothetical protein
MSAISIGGGNHGAAIARVAADWLGLVAAPAFAMMALMTVCLGGGMEPLCSATPFGSLMSGMVPMYVLMGAVHSAPWLRLSLGRGTASSAPGLRMMTAPMAATQRPNST